MTTTDRLPTTRWREPRDIAATLRIPAAGVLLGTTAAPDGGTERVVLAAVGPRVTRIGVVGSRRVAVLLAHRLLGVGCVLRIATAAPDRWRHLLDVAGGRASAAPSTGGWPPNRRVGGPPVLVSDLAEAPDDLARDERRPCTVVHVTGAVPPGGAFWSAVDAVVVTGPGHGAALARLLHRDDALELDGIPPAQLGLLDHSEVVAVTPLLAPGE